MPHFRRREWLVFTRRMETDVEIQEALEKAWAAVVDSGVPESVQQIAFREALARIAPLTPAAPAPVVNRPNPPAGPKVNGGAGAPKDETSSGEPESALPANELMAKLAHETGISAEKWERVIHFSDGKPGISVPTRRLGSNKANQTRAIALLLTAARYYALDEAETSVDVVREACNSAKCYDQANYSRHVADAPGLNLTGPRNQKKLKTRGDTLPKLSALIDKINGDEES